MTVEEAIKHFEAQEQCNYRPTKEAAELAISVLRAKHNTEKLDRSRWEKCWRCNFSERFYKYCPECGRPQTEEAWAELEKRIGEKQ